MKDDLKAKSDDVIALSANLKQLTARTDIQELINENKKLVKRNQELGLKVNEKELLQSSVNKNSILIFVVAIVAMIIGGILNRIF